MALRRPSLSGFVQRREFPRQIARPGGDDGPSGDLEFTAFGDVGCYDDLLHVTQSIAQGWSSREAGHTMPAGGIGDSCSMVRIGFVFAFFLSRCSKNKRGRPYRRIRSPFDRLPLETQWPRSIELPSPRITMAPKRRGGLVPNSRLADS